jgi:hypothetical protein
VRSFPPSLACSQIELRRDSPKPRRREGGRSAACARPEGLRSIGEGGIDQRIRRSRSDTGPDNRQEIVSKIRE